MGKLILCLLPGCLLLAVGAAGQTDDPAFAPLTKAYQALRANDYDVAIDNFRQAVAMAPDRPAIREDFAYTLLKVGDTEGARDEFAEAVRLDSGNDQIALEYAFLCYETKHLIVSRRMFERLSKAGNTTAEETFENVDRPLREGIARWQQAVQLAPDNLVLMKNWRGWRSRGMNWRWHLSIMKLLAI